MTHYRSLLTNLPALAHVTIEVNVREDEDVCQKAAHWLPQAHNPVIILLPGTRFFENGCSQ